MDEWLRLANTTGVALAVLAAVGFAFWRLGKLVAHKLFGNPDANPPVKGAVDVYLEHQQQFFNGLEAARASQQTLCERHAESLETIAAVLSNHDSSAQQRASDIKSLLAMHTDASIPHSTAEAIETVHRLKLVALATCDAGRELANGDRAEWPQAVCKHCDAIEKILLERQA